MSNVFKRTVSAVGLALAVVVLAGAPAFAATVGITASVNNAGVVTVPSSTSINLGDTVTLTNTSSPFGSIHVFGGGTCGGAGNTDFGLVPVGGLITLGTFAAPAFQTGSVVHFSILGITGGICAPFDVAIGASPPPDVAETPYVAGLLGAAAVVFGVGFFTVRRRRRQAV